MNNRTSFVEISIGPVDYVIVELDRDNQILTHVTKYASSPKKSSISLPDMGSVAPAAITAPQS